MEKVLCNAYTELNDPHKQRELFEEQAKVPVRNRLSKAKYSGIYFNKKKI